MINNSFCQTIKSGFKSKESLSKLQDFSRTGWLNDSKMKLQGFRSEGGRFPVTTGIQMWSKPFLVTTDEGEEVSAAKAVMIYECLFC